MSWDRYRREFQGEKDYEGAAQSEEYGRIFFEARKRFQDKQYATISEVRALYRRVARQLKDEIGKIRLGFESRTNLENILAAVESAGKQIEEELLDKATSGIHGAVEAAVDGPEKIAQIVLNGFATKVEVQQIFSGVSARATKSLLARTRHGGLTLSERVWRISKHAKQGITRVIEDGVARGLDSRKLAKQVQQYVQPGVWTAMKNEKRRDLGVAADVSYEAMRLAVTETNNAFHEGTVSAYQAIPSSTGIYWRLSGRHVINDVCNDYAAHNGNGFYPKGEEPAKPHPWCFCVAIPAMEETNAFKTRMREWMKDKNSHPDIEKWYQDNAKRFMPRPDDEEETPSEKIFMQHGASARAAKKIVKIGSDLATQALSMDEERVAAIDLVSGLQVGDTISGSSEKVSFVKLLRHMEDGKKYGLLHGHPRSSTFSPDDLLPLTRLNVGMVSVFGSEDDIYVVSLAEEINLDAKKMMGLWEEETKSITDNVSHLKKEGKSENEANKILRHKSMQKLAKLLGLRYNKINE